MIAAALQSEVLDLSSPRSRVSFAKLSMAQSKSISNNGGNSDGRSKSAGNKTGGGAASSQLILIELKQRILCALNKLADRDTQHIALEDLERIAETLTPEGVSLCLSCLYDTDSQQKATVRKECVKMFGTLASLHDDLLAPHVSKIVINIVKRLRDPDSSIRDACVDTMGTLAAKVSANGGGSEGNNATAFAGALGVFAKPLFDVLNEQSKSVQAGAALCLAGVIDNLKDPPAASLQRLCPRIIKLLNSPTFTAKAALLSVIASIVQAGGTASYQCLAMVIACVQECLKSNDWATRKAAAETLACMASSVGPSLGTFKSSVLEALEACRFDKVKPVRDMVIQTLQVWKRIPSLDSEHENVSSIKENDRSEVLDFQHTKRKVDGSKDSIILPKNKAYVNSDNESQDGGCFGFGHSRSAANKIHGDLQKKRAPLVDKSSNPPFFVKLEKKDPTNWQIDIALPRACTGGTQDTFKLDASKHLISERKGFQEQFGLERITDQDLLDTYGRRREEALVTSTTSLTVLDSHIFDDSGASSTNKSQRLTKHSSCTDSTSQVEEADIGSWSIGAGVASSSSSSIVDSQAVNSDSDAALIRQQLFHIENQQTNILDLLQKLMNRSEESLSKLEARVAGVESIVGNLVTDLANVNPLRSGKVLVSSEHSTPKIWKKSDNSGFMQDRPHSSESILSSRGGRISPLLGAQLATGVAGLNDNRLSLASSNSILCETQANSWRLHADVSSDTHQRRSRTEADGNHLVNKNVQDRGAALRLGEGPSARSIWQASKDEATLAAIRVAGDDGRIKVPDSVKIAAGSNHVTAEITTEVSVHKIGGQGKGPFWSLWARAAEFLRSGDVDSAYVEVLCAGDELLLVRLMSRTGPVLEQLSSGTTQELLRMIVQLTLQQRYLDVIIPWAQQVSDLVEDNGSDCLGLTLDTKRDLVGSLEEAATSNYPEKWIATTLHEVAVQLATKWGLV